jgi:PAS domain S-box-containing protein
MSVTGNAGEAKRSRRLGALSFLQRREERHGKALAEEPDANGRGARAPVLRLYIALVVLVVLLLAGMMLALRTGNQLLSRDARLFDSVTELQLELALAHLWFEEVLAGDRRESIDTVWRHLEAARGHARVLREIESTTEKGFLHLEAPLQRERIEQIEGKLEDIAALAQERWKTRRTSGLGTRSDQQHDELLEELLGLCEEVKAGVQELMAEKKATVDGLRVGLFGGAVLLLGLLGLVFRHHSTERKRKEDELRQSQHRFRSVFASSGDGIHTYDTNSRVTLWNPAMERISGVASEEIIGRSLFEAFPFLETIAEADAIRGSVEGKTAALSEMPYEQPETGRKGWFESTHFPLRDAEGRILGGLGIIRDITERKRAEEEHRRLSEQLQQAQKMEAVGQLAGGVAHDFNNLLTAILGSVEILLLQAERSPEAIPQEARADLREIEHAARRAAELTQQLLAFSRKQITRPEVLDPRRLLAETEEMLHRVIREDTEVDMVIRDGTRHIRADRSQLVQVLINLVVNASDAMPHGGRMTIECADVELDDAHVAAHPGARPGPHVMLAVADEGIGMSSATMEHIFEPFFTTKPVGQGTGMGLATVYGIVSGGGAHLSVESEPGSGSTFRVYFPAVEEELQEPSTSVAGDRSGGSEVILVCEDEEGVRRVASRALRAAGYTVLEAKNGRSALELVAEHDGEIHMLVTDVVMPEMNGRELAEAISSHHPGIRTLFVSGHAKEVLDQRDVESDGTDFLAKPFSPTVLLQRVRELFDG